ncbi:MAG: hypothetical protein ACRY3E_00310 [Candidatus Lariskella arthropodorum]|uniref:hypothetical protein n=1 Tax=Candidatus Lariskella endosymbiont of Epinotia ramella TaxID=3066224 RepID=UPI0030D3D332
MPELNSTPQIDTDRNESFNNIKTYELNSNFDNTLREFTSIDYMGRYRYKHKGYYMVYVGLDFQLVEAITALEAIKKQQNSAAAPTKVVICLSGLPMFPPESLEIAS